MLYNTLYNGPKIDELLEAIGHIKSVVNGWVRFESTEDYPTDLNDLINPGNFSTMYWINSPEDYTFGAPIKVVVTKENDKNRQYIFSTGFNTDGHYRDYDPSTSKFGNWESIHLNKGITVSDTAPTNPKDNDLWINTSNKDAIIQYYDSNLEKWTSLNPYDYMDSSIYNPNGVEFQDVYAYIDDKVKNVSGGESPVDFSAHIKDTSIHISRNEKDIFDNKMTSDSLLTAMQTLAEELNQYVATKASQSGVNIPAIERLVANIINTLTTHINDSTIHPTQSQIDDWNSKSNKIHTHNVDEIKIDTSDVIGNINIENIPDDARERQVTVTSEEALLALTINEVQNGDFVYIDYGEDNNEVLIVIDQTKLGTREAFLSYSTPSEELKWENVKDKPTTIEQLGIENSLDNSQVDSIIDDLSTKTASAQAEVDATVDRYEYCNNDRIKNTHNLESEIDSSDYKLNVLYNATIVPEDIVSKLEAIVQ